MNKKEKRKVDPVWSLVGGGISGLATCVLLQPLDLVKTRLQQDLQSRQNLIKTAPTLHLPSIPIAAGQSCKGSIPLPTHPPLTLLSTARTVVQTNGLPGLWRGTWPTILRNVPGTGLYFLALEELRRVLRHSGVGNSHLINVFSGGAARVAVGYVLMPITVLKVRFESNLYNYPSIPSGIRSIIQKEGVRGLFAGFGATAMRDAPHAGLYVLFYEFSKGRLQGLTKYNSAYDPFIHMFCGMLSGTAATVITNPFDVVKTRMQLQPSVYKDMIQSGLKIASEEHFRGFFAGMLPRLLRKSFSSAITWTIYEEVLRYGRNDTA
ncbi:mitochondrial carrier domain-containing protein [Phlyctochytrium arcticum]|nr:mitochondrial carrier domain-containing protein [Phlyctochytrium arcticum]